MSSKAVITSLIKFIIVVGLVYWMVATDKLHFSELKVFITYPVVTLVTILLWLFVQVLLGTYRWYCLLQGVGLQCSYWRAVQLQLVGFFFNLAMPGAVGGDIIKAMYIVKDQEDPTGKTPAMLTVLLDRIVGLIGLFMMGLIAAMFNFSILWNNATTRSLFSFLVLIVVGTLVFLGIVYSPHSDDRDPFLRILNANVPGFSLLKKIYVALRAYRRRPLVLFKTIGITVVIQFFFLTYMWYLSGVMNGKTAHFGLLATVFPFGLLVTAVPLAPGGLGIGHVAFDRLFSLIGEANGANIFNIYSIGILVLNMSGFIPYLAMRSKLQQKNEALGSPEPKLTMQR